jgi:ribose transport system permease protein
MKRIYGILGLLICITIFTAVMSDNFTSAYNIENLLRRTALFGIIGIGAAVVIITGGIDLSIGSVVCLAGCMLPWLVMYQEMAFVPAALLVLCVSVLIGLFHGVLITRFNVQPFIVTLCGLLLYRGIARGMTADQTQGFGNKFAGFREIAVGRVSVPGIDTLSVPTPLLIMLFIAVLVGFSLRMTSFGQHLYATGFNEQAARFSGIGTRKLITAAYCICGLLAGIGGVLFVSDVNSAQPADFGNFYELYAIAAAVLGGCSLRGGEGSVIGVLIGTAVIQVLRNAITLLDIPTQLEFAIIGSVILAGATVDQLLRMKWRKGAAASV